ncbi:MAG: restriction endonuclease subunit S [Anaerolineaceae bacterium]|nr:restriction endonuclease subunit S [Anaerolineaceae bacterium]
MMKVYPEYKKSKYAWVSNIPKGWGIVALKHLVFPKITDGPHETPVLVDDGIPFISAEAVQNGRINFDSRRGNITENQHMIYAKKCLPQRDDIFFVKSGATTGKLAYVDTDIEFGIWSPIAVIRAKATKTLPQYLFHAIGSNYFQMQVQTSWSYGTQPNIGMGVLENLRIIIPSLPEQHAITVFLDRKITQIDELIEKKQRQVELLQEYRTALINQAVTKGLNPDVPMKDSGIEWLGEMPIHWEVKKLKYVTRKINDGSHFTPTYVEKGIPFLRVTDIQCKEIDLDKVKRIPKDEYEILNKRCNPEKGDILLSKNGTIGLTKVVDWEFPFSIFVSLCLIKFNNQIDPNFFSYFFQSNVVNEQIFSSSKQSTVTNLHLDKIRELIMNVPNIEEQQEIVKWLDLETDNIHKTSINIQTQIDHLQEYRTAIISSAVTGKIDVRDSMSMGDDVLDDPES